MSLKYCQLLEESRGASQLGLDNLHSKKKIGVHAQGTLKFKLRLKNLHVKIEIRLSGIMGIK